MSKFIYLIGSLRNKAVPEVAEQLRKGTGHYVFDEWYSAGEHADDSWRDHQKLKGRSYKEALRGEAAQHVFNFDKKFLDLSDTVVLLMPAGKSGHLEFGYSIGRGAEGYILFDAEPERYDVMTNFATDVFFDIKELIQRLQESKTDTSATIVEPRFGPIEFTIPSETSTSAFRASPKNSYLI